MSLFGAQSQPSTNIFGSTSSQQQPGQTTSGNIFGNTPSQPSTSGASPFGTTSTATNTAAGTSSGGLFGNTGAQQQQQPAANLFGNMTTAQQGGLFGSTNTQTQPAGTNMFGTATTQPSGNVFGNAGAQQQQQQQPQTSTQPSTSIFGNPSTTTTGAPAGNIFGNTSAQQQQQPASGGLFGAAATTTTQQPAAGGLFGNTNTQTQPVGTTLFGNTGTQQQQQPQSSFGSTTQPSGGLFGTSTTQPSIFGSSSQAPASGGLFASTSAPATGGGLFGSTNASSNPLFGNKTPASIFGTAPTNSSTAPNFLGQPAQGSAAPSLFGQSQQTPAGSLFGSTNQPVQGATRGLFGSTQGAPAFNSLLASRSIAPVQQQDPQSQYAALEQKIQAIVQAWNPASPECRFQHYFYNLVPPEQVSAYGRPSNATNEALWQRAVRDNPNPSCMVPVLAVGFDDLRQRVDGQSKQAAEQQKGLMELKKRLESLSPKHNDSNASRLERAKALQSQIQHRLLCLIQHMHLMLPTVRSTAIRPEEDALRVALEEIEEDIKRPGGVGKMRGKLNELWALVGSINAARERGRKVGLDGTSDWTVVDEEGLKQISQILSNQQAGLQHLTQVLQRDLRDLEVIYGKES